MKADNNNGMPGFTAEAIFSRAGKSSSYSSGYFNQFKAMANNNIITIAVEC